jgi:hypothetical protein
MSDRSLIQRRPTGCGVSECDHEASIMEPPGSLGLWRCKKIVMFCLVPFTFSDQTFECLHKLIPGL